jgi:hypothetical protein
MGEHLESTECPWCGAVIHHLNTEDPSCRCSWDLDEDFRDNLRVRCDELGEDYDQLLEDLGGDLEPMDSYLWAMGKDD